MRYSKSMIEAVKQVAMYEQFDYALLDRDNRIIAIFKGKDAKKQAELNKKSARVKQPAKVYPINPGDKRKIGDTIIAIGELTDKQRGEIEELFGISSNANHRSKTMKMLDGMNIKYEKSGRNGLVIKGVPKNKQQDLLNKIKKDVGMYNTATKEELEEDVKNALAGFDNRIRDAASMDRKDFIKAKELYKRKDVKGLRKHIYSLDTSPLEVIMNLISIQDRPFFDKMYPNTRGGEF